MTGRGRGGRWWPRARPGRAWLAGCLDGHDGPPHVGVLLGNVPEYLWWLGAAALAGATVVGINPTRRGDALAADVRRTAAPCS